MPEPSDAFLPPYNPTAQCPHCGNDDVSTGFRDREDMCYITSTRSRPCGGRSGPHLHRECRRCCFAWAEASLSAPSEVPDA